MSRHTNSDNHQLSFDFSAPEIVVEKSNIDQAEVVSLNVYAQSRQLTIQTHSVLERLLQEEQKLRW